MREVTVVRPAGGRKAPHSLTLARTMTPPLVPDSFDPSSRAFVADPSPTSAQLRALGPVAWSPRTGQYVVARAAEIDTVLRDRRFGRSYLQVATHADMGRPDDAPHLAP